VVKAAHGAVGAKVPTAGASVREAIRILDKAVTKGIIHRNTAARKKSVLARRLAAH
jgi:small subunit ribosomal protein S20